MNTTFLFFIEGIKILYNIQYSKIGYGYPRLFIEVKEGVKWIMCDLTLGCTLPCSVKDGQAWYAEAIIPTAKDIADNSIDKTMLTNIAIAIKSIDLESAN